MSKATVIDLGAYDWRPKSPNSKCWTFRIGNTTFQFQKLPVMIVSFISFFLLLIYWSFSGSSRIEIQGFNHSYPLTKPLQTPQGIKYRIAVIADLDTDSKSDKNTWKSYLKLGSLTYDFQEENVQINWEDAQELKSSFSIGGRGMELSELVVFNGNLLTVDDRTGIVYKLTENNQKWKIIPWVILADGNGEESKGFKCEWMAVKGQFLYVGGLGKEWTTQDGKVLNFNPMYVKKISKNGHVEHVNWYENYIKLRSRAGIEFPGE